VDGSASSSVLRLASTRIFLSYWYEDAGPQSIDVTVTLQHNGGLAPGKQAQLFLIDQDHAAPNSAWTQMGSPSVPSDAQLEELQASADATKPVRLLALSAASPTSSMFKLTLQRNTAAVVALEPPSA